MVAGRIERILVRAGEPVEPETVILELSNPDVQLEALEAQRELAAAESEYLSLEQRLRTELLDQRAVAMEARADQRDAERQAAANDELAAGDLIPRLDAERSSDAASTAAERAAVETERYELRANGIQAQLAVQRRQVERMRAVVRFQEEQVTSMQVVAGAAGVPGGAARSRPVGAAGGRPGKGRRPGAPRGRDPDPRDPGRGREPRAERRGRSADRRRQGPRGARRSGGPAGNRQGRHRDPDSLPAGARPDQAVDGTIEIERLPAVLHVGRPAAAQPATQVSLFKLVDGGNAAVRVPVRLGRASVTTIEVLEGLAEGDEVILSDMSRWDDVDRVRIE